MARATHVFVTHFQSPLVTRNATNWKRFVNFAKTEKKDFLGVSLKWLQETDCESCRISTNVGIDEVTLKYHCNHYSECRGYDEYPYYESSRPEEKNCDETQDGNCCCENSDKCNTLSDKVIEDARRKAALNGKEHRANLMSCFDGSIMYNQNQQKKSPTQLRHSSVFSRF